MPTTWVKTEPVGKVTVDNDIWAGRAEETHQYRVTFSDENATGAEALIASGIPQPTTGGFITQLMTSAGDPTGLYINKRRATQVEDDKRLWLVDVGYSSIGITGQQPQQDGQTKWGVNVSGTYVVRQETVNQDKDKNPIVNSAGEAFDTKLTVPKWDLQINVSYYTKSPDWATIDSCFQKVNSEDVTIHIGPTTRTFLANTLKFEGLTFAFVYGPASDKLVQMNEVYIHRPSADGWTTYVDDMGFNMAGIDADGNDCLWPILDGNHEPIKVAAYLDGSGNKLADGADVVRLPFDLLESTSFTTLLSEIP